MDFGSMTATSINNTTSELCSLTGPSNEAPPTKANIWADRLGGHFEQLNSAHTTANKIRTDVHVDRSNDHWTNSAVDSYMPGTSRTESTGRTLTSSSTGLLNSTGTTSTDGSGLLLPNESSFIQQLNRYQNPTNLNHQPQTTDQLPGSRRPSALNNGLNQNHQSHVDPKVFCRDYIQLDSTDIVAQIIGKGGIKIAALSKKFNIRFETPRRGQPSVIVLKGAPSDVLLAKQEIERMALHYRTRKEDQQHNSGGQKSDSYVLKVYLPTQHHGLVIGKKGACIINTTLEHHVFVEIPRCHNTEYFKLTGPETNVFTVVLKWCTFLCTKTGRQFDRIYSKEKDQVHLVERVTPPPMGQHKPLNSFQNPSHFNLQPQTTVHQSASRQTTLDNRNLRSQVNPDECYCNSVVVRNATVVGHILGKCGIKHKQLSDKHHVLIQVRPSGSEFVFLLQGARDNVLQAKEDIEIEARHFESHEQAKQDKLNSFIHQTGSIIFKVFVPAQYHFIVIGKNGFWINNIKKSLNVLIESPKLEQDIPYFKVIGKETKVFTIVDRIVTHLSTRTRRPFHRIYSELTRDVNIVEGSQSPEPTLS